MKKDKIIPQCFELYKNINEDYLGLVAAGVAFYFLMAAFPVLAAAISLYGLFSDPHFVSEQIQLLSRFLPEQALDIFANQARRLVESNSGTLGLSFLISIILTIYSATKGIRALIKGLNIAYNEKETRGFFKLSMTGFMLTFVLMTYMLAALTLVAVLPAVFSLMHLPDITSAIYLHMRWPLLSATALIGIEILYYYGPSRKVPKWHWISLGSSIATASWLVISYLFSLFVTHFGNYNETYGSISAIVILLLWFWLSALMILIGAEINMTFHHGAGRRRVHAHSHDEQL